MITIWHMIPLHVGDRQVSEIEVKFDLTYIAGRGWLPTAVLVEDLDGSRGNALVRIEADGKSLGEMSLMGPAIIHAASKYFFSHQDEVMEAEGLLNAAE